MQLLSWSLTRQQFLVVLGRIQPLWRNWLARSAVNRKVGGSSPPRGAKVYFTFNWLVFYYFFLNFSLDFSINIFVHFVSFDHYTWFNLYLLFYIFDHLLGLQIFSAIPIGWIGWFLTSVARHIPQCSYNVSSTRFVSNWDILFQVTPARRCQSNNSTPSNDSVARKRFRLPTTFFTNNQIYQ